MNQKNPKNTKTLKNKKSYLNAGLGSAHPCDDWDRPF
jgi:hypothetical protein